MSYIFRSIISFEGQGTMYSFEDWYFIKQNPTIAISIFVIGVYGFE